MVHITHECLVNIEQSLEVTRIELIYERLIKTQYIVYDSYTKTTRAQILFSKQSKSWKQKCGLFISCQTKSVVYVLKNPCLLE